MYLPSPSKIVTPLAVHGKTSFRYTPTLYRTWSHQRHTTGSRWHSPCPAPNPGASRWRPRPSDVRTASAHPADVHAGRLGGGIRDGRSLVGESPVVVGVPAQGREALWRPMVCVCLYIRTCNLPALFGVAESSAFLRGSHRCLYRILSVGESGSFDERRIDLVCCS